MAAGADRNGMIRLLERSLFTLAHSSLSLQRVPYIRLLQVLRQADADFLHLLFGLFATPPQLFLPFCHFNGASSQEYSKHLPQVRGHIAATPGSFHLTFFFRPANSQLWYLLSPLGHLNLIFGAASTHPATGYLLWSSTRS